MPAPSTRPAPAIAVSDTMNDRMAMTDDRVDAEPARADIDALEGPAVVEFGASWCGVCRRTRPLIAAAVAAHSRVRHVRIEDGPGRPLGRSFGVKLWPTLVFLRDGKQIAKLVRPNDATAIARALEQIDAA